MGQLLIKKKRFTISEVAPGWREPMNVTSAHIISPLTARVQGHLNLGE